MGYAVVGVMDTSKQVFMVRKRFSMAVTLHFKQLKISVENMSVRKTRLQKEYKSKHRTSLHFGRGLHIFSCFHITIINANDNSRTNALFSNEIVVLI